MEPTVFSEIKAKKVEVSEMKFGKESKRMEEKAFAPTHTLAAATHLKVNFYRV